MTTKSQKFWDKQAERYDRSEKRFKSVSERILAKTGKYLGPHDNVLEVGCATGTKTLALAGKVKHIHGLDISGEMVKEAMKKKEDAAVSNCSFSRGTVFDEDLAAGTYDAVIAYSVVHLLEDAAAATHRIHELLKPGGVFISTTALFHEKMTLTTKLTLWGYRLLKKLGIFPLHLNVFSLTDLEKLVEGQGFRVVEAETFQHGMTACFLVVRK